MFVKNEEFREVKVSMSNKIRTRAHTCAGACSEGAASSGQPGAAAATERPELMLGQARWGLGWWLRAWWGLEWRGGPGGGPGGRLYGGPGVELECLAWRIGVWAGMGLLL